LFLGEHRCEFVVQKLRESEDAADGVPQVVRRHAEKLSFELIEPFESHRRLFHGRYIHGRASNPCDNPVGVAKWLNG